MAIHHGVLTLLTLTVAATIQSGQALECYACIPGTRCFYSYEVSRVRCTGAQDTCFSFRGDVLSSGVIYRDLITRSCGMTSVFYQYDPPIYPNRCSNVSMAMDPYTKEIYSGRFCLCNGSYCNYP
ncbi:hypothetical protein RvY_01465 [Ramazzottius varieornatus]|uniref:UPAR/Ly6 domain-containing protein n=1 Tax=Ramazzottius varieornatus TaxID=947166 RepID=A0A1D1UJY4_RAMVA|nr:hypothetical protein RvY_01465 [Ramazzottius varieornatus]